MPQGRGATLKDRELYEELRDEGNSKEKAARISNAVAAQGAKTVGRRGGKSATTRTGPCRAARTREGARPPELLGQAQGGAHLDAPQSLGTQGVPRLVRVRPGDSPASGACAPERLPLRRRAWRSAPEDDRERIHDLVIPPAWEDVWISVEPYGHIQAVGVDEAGRRQYLYHAQWRARRDKGKFTRALALAEALPRARGRVTTALRREGLGRERVLATSFRLLDEAAPRIGSARYLEKHGSRGLTTLQRRDAAIDDADRHALVPWQERQARLHRDRRRRARRSDGGAGDRPATVGAAVVPARSLAACPSRRPTSTPMCGR